MPRITLDTREALDRKPLPDGQYETIVKEFRGPTKGPKSTYLTAVLEIPEGENKGRQFYVNLPINGEGAGITADFFSKLTGETIEIGPNSPGLDIDTDDYIGAPIGVVNKQREYPEGSGEFQNNVTKFLAAR